MDTATLAPYAVIAPSEFPAVPLPNMSDSPAVWISVPSFVPASSAGLVHRDFSTLAGVGSFKA